VTSLIKSVTAANDVTLVAEATPLYVHAIAACSYTGVALQGALGE